MSQDLAVIELGKQFAASKYFSDANEAAKAVVKIQAGRELGFGAMASMVGIHIIQGKPALSANLMAAAVKRSGRYNYKVTENTAQNCTIEFYEKDGIDGAGWAKIGVSAFSFEDAKKAQTKNLDKFPRNMLFARAMSNGVRWYCPDVTSGVVIYTPEELGADVDEDGEVVKISKPDVIDNEPQPAPPPAPITKAIQAMTNEEAGRVKIADGRELSKLTPDDLNKVYKSNSANVTATIRRAAGILLGLE